MRWLTLLEGVVLRMVINKFCVWHKVQSRLRGGNKHTVHCDVHTSKKIMMYHVYHIAGKLQLADIHVNLVVTVRSPRLLRESTRLAQNWRI